MAKDLFNRYVWLVDTIYRAGRITFEELNERWVRRSSENEEIPLRTFHNHRKAIEALFDINIECDKRNGYRYYIENIDDMERGGVRSWLLNTFAVNNLINESHKLKRRILFEQIPSGQQFLTPIIEAMRDKKAIEMLYHSFNYEHPRLHTLEPYCIKVFRQRWYVIGKLESHTRLLIFALDRIQEVKQADYTFKLPKDFNAEMFFNESFGIIVDEHIPAETVRLKVSAQQAKYIRSLPLHHSQQEEKPTAGFSLFSYYIRPTYDFRQEVLSHGAEVEVLEPAWLRKEIKREAEKMCSQYSR